MQHSMKNDFHSFAQSCNWINLQADPDAPLHGKLRCKPHVSVEDLPRFVRALWDFHPTRGWILNELLSDVIGWSKQYRWKSCQSNIKSLELRLLSFCFQQDFNTDLFIFTRKPCEIFTFAGPFRAKRVMRLDTLIQWYFWDLRASNSNLHDFFFATLRKT